MIVKSKTKMKFTKLIVCSILALGLVSGAVDFGDNSRFIGISQAYAKPAPTSFADLSEKVVPSVVNISTTQIIRGAGDSFGFPEGFGFNDRFFKEFFGDDWPGLGGGGKVRKRKAMSLGSGFIIDASGLIVTNNHVVGDADEIEVVLHDGTRLEAEIVGRDEKVDIALIKVNTKKKLKAVSLGDSDKVRVGDWVLAVGNPFGLGNTVTAGIISARARNINAGPYDDFFQTDASINRGNSGGPMFDTTGKVIGINTVIFSPSGGSVGIGFAVPSNLAKWVVEDLKQYGRTRRSWIGVKIQEVTEEIAESIGLEEAKGALILGVSSGSPADKVGIKPGDVILSFDGKEIKDMQHLPRMVAETGIGKKAKIKLWRDGAIKHLMITLAELEDEKASHPKKAKGKAKDKSENDNVEKVESLGLKLTEITPAIRKRLGIPEEAGGVVVVGIDDDSDAEDKGLRKGMVILEVNQSSITTVADVEEQVKAAKANGRKSVLMLVETSKGLRFVAIKLK
ncbi:MAG: DegQ family serine endoprotease [Alphaproteobacteria bacterium]|nr:DegQ family serine endoprotease [Alphaproteobacteria bacterium]